LEIPSEIWRRFNQDGGEYDRNIFVLITGQSEEERAESKNEKNTINTIGFKNIQEKIIYLNVQFTEL
jgi:hypothetical protein